MPGSRQPSTCNVIVVANGKFPEHSIPLKLLQDAKVIVCCDGAAENVDRMGLTPRAIVGDLDSLSEKLKQKYNDSLFQDNNTEINDLTKAIRWCLANGYHQVNIIGATGLRDDHTLGNIGLLPSYAQIGMKVKMYTDHGTIFPIIASTSIGSFKGQQVSIFSPNNDTNVTSFNLKYPIRERSLRELWMGTLNESLDNWFSLDFEPGPLIIFQEYSDF